MKFTRKGVVGLTSFSFPQTDELNKQKLPDIVIVKVPVILR